MGKRSLKELIDTQEPAINVLRQFAADAEVPCEILPPGPERENALLYLQVTTHSTLGALAYDTGGILVDNGWLRWLGSGHEKFPRTINDWNSTRTDGAFYLIGDDAAGGFFAINGGAFGADLGSVYYWAPDSLEWESLQAGHTDVVAAFFTNYIEDFYKDLRWSTWREDVQNLSTDRAYFFFPFLWTKEGSLEGSNRSTVPVSELWSMKVETVRQLMGES
jgi:Protein of unknown function DUF2625